MVHIFVMLMKFVVYTCFILLFIRIECAPTFVEFEHKSQLNSSVFLVNLLFQEVPSHLNFCIVGLPYSMDKLYSPLES